MFEAAERILCLRAQIARLWQRLLLSAIERKEGRERRDARDERRRGGKGRILVGEPIHLMVSLSPHDVGYRREARSATGGRKRIPSSEFHPLLSASRDKQIVCRTLQHAKIAPTFPLVGLRFVGEIRKIERSRE